MSIIGMDTPEDVAQNESESGVLVKQFVSDAHGRGLLTTVPVSRGRLLLVGSPYCAVLAASERSQSCENCLIRKQHLSRCSKCRQARYCGTTCQRSDWTAHRLECPVLCAFGPSWTPPETVRLVARILTKQKTSTKKCPSEELFTIGELQSHLSDLSVEQKELIGQYIRILHKYYSKHVEFPGNEELIELFSKVNCNSFTIEDEELIHVGAALYPSLALLNHSCDFNCVVTFHGTTAEVHAVRDLLAGEELLINYIDLLYTSFDRIAQLQDLYFFTCTCKLCKTHHLDNEKLCIKQAGERPTEGEVNEMIKYSQAKIKEIREAKHVRSPEELLEMCKQCQTRQETVFAGGNVYNLHVEYQAMGAYLYLGQTKQALKLGLNLIKCYQTLYPPNSVNVAALWIKIGRLQRDLEKPIGAIDSFHKALEIMEITHGNDHPFVRDLSLQVKTM